MSTPDASVATTYRKYAAIASTLSLQSKGVTSGGYSAGKFSFGRLLPVFTRAQKSLIAPRVARIIVTPITLNFTTYDTYTIPSGYTLVTFEVSGHSGYRGAILDDYGNGIGGRGSKLSGKFSVISGDRLNIKVDTLGGDGGIFSGFNGGNGGGLSAINLNDSRLVIASGGGGGGSSDSDTDPTTNGGNGWNGQPGTATQNGIVYYGADASLSSSGSSGQERARGATTVGGAAGPGGNARSGDTSPYGRGISNNGTSGGGGGGSGYHYGGGGGLTPSNTGGGGGGGSSFVSTLVQNPSIELATSSGVTITLS